MNHKPFKIFSIIQLIIFVFLAFVGVCAFVSTTCSFLDSLEVAPALMDSIKDFINDSFPFILGCSGAIALSEILDTLSISGQLTLLIVALIYLLVSIYAIRVVVYSIKGIRGKCDYYFQRQVIGNIFVVLFLALLAYNAFIIFKNFDTLTLVCILNIVFILGVLLNFILKICGRIQTLKAFKNLPESPAERMQGKNNKK